MKSATMREFLLIVLCTLLISCSSSGGGTTGTGGYDYNGNVTDESGNPIAGVAVTLLDAQGEEVASTSTDSSGNFSLPQTAINVGSVLLALPDGGSDQVSVTFPDQANSVQIKVRKKRDGGVEEEVEFEKRERPRDRENEGNGDQDKGGGRDGDDSSDRDDSNKDNDDEDRSSSGNSGNGSGGNGGGNGSGKGNNNDDDSDDAKGNSGRGGRESDS